MGKIKIIQQYFKMQVNNGGPATGANLLLNSELKDKYEFVSMDEYHSSFINWKLFCYFYKTIKSVNPDIVHIRGVQLEGFWGVLASKLCKKKVVLSVHGLYADSVSLDGIKKWIFRRLLEPYALKNADLVYCVCQYAASRDYIRKNARNLYGYIHNAAPDAMRPNEEVRRASRSEYGFSDEDIVISIVGRVTYDKGFGYLLDAVDRIMLDGNIKFLIAGDGPYLRTILEKCEQYISTGDIVCLGKTDRVKSVLCASDIFLFPTLHENLSNALLEAGSVGLPIIATNVGGNSEVIKDGYNGTLIEPSNAEAIIRAVEELVDDKKKREMYSKNILYTIKEKFAKEKIFGEIDKMYEKLINS